MVSLWKHRKKSRENRWKHGSKCKWNELNGNMQESTEMGGRHGESIKTCGESKETIWNCIGPKEGYGNAWRKVVDMYGMDRKQMEIH